MPDILESLALGSSIKDAAESRPEERLVVLILKPEISEEVLEDIVGMGE